MSNSSINDPLPFESCQDAFERGLSGRGNKYEPGSAEDLAHAYGAELRQSEGRASPWAWSGLAAAEHLARIAIKEVKRCKALTVATSPFSTSGGRSRIWRSTVL